MSDKTICRLPEVLGRTGLSRSSIYKQVAEGTFPEPINLGSKAIGWLNNEIDAWITEQIEKSRKDRDG